MRSRRWLFFLLTILVGLAAGLVVGWYVRPQPPANLPVNALRQDFRTDYALMVAEIYTKDGDITLAEQRLSVMDSAAPVRLAQQAALSATEYGYAPADIQLLVRLGQALQAIQPVGGGAP